MKENQNAYSLPTPLWISEIGMRCLDIVNRGSVDRGAREGSNILLFARRTTRAFIPLLGKVKPKTFFTIYSWLSIAKSHFGRFRQPRDQDNPLHSIYRDWQQSPYSITRNTARLVTECPNRAARIAEIWLPCQALIRLFCEWSAIKMREALKIRLIKEYRVEAFWKYCSTPNSHSQCLSSKPVEGGFVPSCELQKRPLKVNLPTIGYTEEMCG